MWLDEIRVHVLRLWDGICMRKVNKTEQEEFLHYSLTRKGGQTLDRYSLLYD